MTALRLLATPLAGLVVVERSSVEDDRGRFSRLFSFETLREGGWTKPVAQANHSETRRPGTVRGLHYQRGARAEAKLVSCLRGEVFDVAVDLRRGSPTFLAWHGERLSRENGRALLVPEGFAHGFQALTEDCELIYFTTEPWTADAEGTVHVEEPRVGIRWPLPVSGLSARDRGAPALAADFAGCP